MSFYAKIFWTVVFAMSVMALLLTAILVYRTYHESQRYTRSFNQSLKQFVENWVNTTLPESLTIEEVQQRLTQYQRNPSDAGGNFGLFEQIVLVDRYRRVLQVVPESDRASVGTQVGVSQKLYDTALVESLNKGAAIVDGKTVYRALTRTVHYIHTNEDRVETQWVLKLTLRLDLPDSFAVSELILYLFVAIAFCTLGLWFTMHTMLKWFLKPLDELVGVSESIALGDYTKRLPQLTRDDEVGRLVRAFDRMMHEVRDNRENLEQKVDEAVKKQRRAEQGLLIAQRLAATGTLAAGIAHEINNPLMGMQNVVQRVKKMLGKDGREIEPKIAGYLNDLMDGLKRIEEIVKQVLDMTRRKVNPAPFDMAEPVSQTINFAQHKAKRYDVELIVVPPDKCPAAYADRGEITQVLTNLIINAIDAIRDARQQDAQKTPVPPTRVGKVTVTWKPTDAGITTQVIDTGCGMTQEQAARAFDAFYTTKPDGTGLGLAIVHNIIESHGGSIEMESEVGVGTTVTFTIPKQVE